MRIITGTARGTKLMTLEGDNTRPTPERVKEAVFSMIQFDLEDANFLDLFAGSGQMGLEAVSRGAEKAHLIDKSSEAVDIIRANAEKTRLADTCSIFCTDSTDYLKRSKGRCKFDFVFIDPPYGSGLVQESLRLLADGTLLNDNAWLIVEDETDDIFAGDEELASRFNIEKSNRYGRVHIVVLSLK